MPVKTGLPHGWRCWVAENVLLGVPAREIENQAAAAGVERDTVREEIESAQGDPYVVAGGWLAQRLKKLEAMLQARVEVARQNSAPAHVPSRSQLSAEEFRELFYAQNRPVKLLNIMQDWPAMQRWRPEFFREHYGHQEVEVTSSRDSDPYYEIRLEQHRRSLLFRDFIEIISSGPGNNSYLVANNHFFERPGLVSLLDDVGRLPGYLRQPADAKSTYLWFGPAQTVTPLHHDTMNVLLCQVFGRKRVQLVQPDETPWLYNNVGVFSEVEMEAPDLRRYPLFRHVSPIEVILHPGEMLFIPVGWWHHVRSLDMSISVSFTNFEFPNEYQWQQPEIRRNA